jgi:hypothetical protein
VNTTNGRQEAFLPFFQRIAQAATKQVQLYVNEFTQATFMRAMSPADYGKCLTWRLGISEQTYRLQAVQMGGRLSWKVNKGRQDLD